MLQLDNQTDIRYLFVHQCLCLGLAGRNLEMTQPTALISTGKPTEHMEIVKTPQGTLTVV